MNNRVGYIHNFRLSAQSVNLMSRFVRTAKAKNFGSLRLHDTDILIKMWVTVQTSQDEYLERLFNQILHALNVPVEEAKEYFLTVHNATFDKSKDRAEPKESLLYKQSA